MPTTLPQKLALGIAGTTATAIGLFILFDPTAFYDGYDIGLEGNTNLLSELRALAANLAVLGAIMLAGLAYQSLAKLSAAAGLIVFLSFPFGRILSLVLDGYPSPNILIALAIEVGIGAFCVFAFWPKVTAPEHPIAGRGIG